MNGAMRGRLGVVRRGCGKAGDGVVMAAEWVRAMRQGSSRPLCYGGRSAWRGNETGLFEATLCEANETGLFEAALGHEAAEWRVFRGEGEWGDERAVGGWFAGAVARPGRPCCWGKECVEGQ